MPEEKKNKLERTKSNFNIKCQNENTLPQQLDTLLKALKDLEARVSQLEQWLEDLQEDFTEGWDSTDDFEEDKISETE